jgi:sn-glycerol 3-phosphate transport system ATP-binding protein
LSNVKKTYRHDRGHSRHRRHRDGEFIVLVGPSGCGKSTLLRMVAGLEDDHRRRDPPSAARVNKLEPMERDIAMVFQNYALYPHMSVRREHGLRPEDRRAFEGRDRGPRRRGRRMLQLEPYLDRKPAQLSGGQRQRVAMGRAIVREPAVFLFDEPLSNLDAKLRVQMRLEIKALQRKLGVTALYVTHDQVEAMTLADRMIVMNAGVAEQIGAPLEVYIRRVSWHLTPPAAARKSETVQCSSTASATAHCRLPLTTTHWSSRP